MENTFEVRDMRHKEKFAIDDLYLNGYAKICGIYATGVYVSLCRHADKEQKCWPSVKKIADELRISQTQTRRAIKILKDNNIIKVERLGKKLNNRYYLIDKSEWSSGIITDSPDRTITTSPQDTHPLPDRTLHSKETHIKDTHSKDTATHSVADNNLNSLIDIFSTVNPSYKRLFPNKSERAALKRLVEQHGTKKITQLLGVLPRSNKMPFSPTITTPCQLERKLGDLLAFISKERIKAEDKKLDIAVRTTK